MEFTTICNLCGSETFAVFGEKIGKLTGKVFRIVFCTRCGLKFVSPRLGKEENYTLYGEPYFYGEGFDEAVNYVALSENQDTGKDLESKAILKKIQIFNKNHNARILDIGCGTGSFVNFLEREEYAHVTGFEMSEFASKVARQHCRSRIITGDFLEYDFGGEQFNIINATEVIEHIRDPLSFFKKVKAILKKGGLFIYSTGNADSWYARFFGTSWPYITPEGHLFYYTPRTLERYFERVGLVPRMFRDLSLQQKKILLSSEDDISYFLLKDVGKNDKSLKGFVFRSIALVPKMIIGRLLTYFVGKYKLPLAFNRPARVINTNQMKRSLPHSLLRQISITLRD